MTVINPKQKHKAMNTLKNILYKVIPVLMLVGIWVSCKDDEIEAVSLSRQFKPAAFEITEGETTATIGWSASLFTVPGEVEYTIEFSKDVEFSNVEYETTTSALEVTVLDTDIDIKTDYYARVKAVGSNGANDSNWLISEPFQITGEIFILPVNEYDVVTDAVIIRWDLEEVLTKITITPTGGGSSVDVAITLDEYNEGEKLIEGLTQNTEYTAEIFNADGVSKGAVTFRTKNAYTDSNVVDLRAITGKPKILRDTLQDIPAGSVVWLRRGEVYTFDNTDGAPERSISKSVTIMSGPGFDPNFARIHVTTNFNLPLLVNTVIDSIVFKDLIYKGVRAGGTSFDSDYILNVSVGANTAAIGKVRLENCKISRLRGVVRLQGAGGAHIDNLFINKCAVDSIREFGIVMTSTGGPNYFANTSITNSTFSKCRRFVDIRNAGTETFNVENCTFNELPSGGVENTETNYFIDFVAVNSTNPIQVTNCILGKTWNEGAGNFVRGVRAGAATIFNVTNTYTLSDFISTNATYLIPGTSAYTGASTAVYQSPSTGNFTIIDASFPGADNAGDPKWRQQ